MDQRLLFDGLILYLGLLVRRFSIFTTISMFGVFLGVAAPIIVMSTTR